MLTFCNDGKKLISTNYWESDYARNGLAYLSWNAGAARLLLPFNLINALKEISDSKYVIVSRGAWAAQGGRDAIELLFEDNSDSPYCLHLSAQQTDRLLPEEDQGSGFIVRPGVTESPTSRHMFI